ncbi:hypothetical protein EST38_g1104 [Candolleomyces aberdarensis]|uniref:Uncharacterized protein n=1 Tax=Candolleomyces aberdarensis TaxID=2316362 RepID=A0A4V1Q589_9AGAR|nr:hypothetical protein EST38_g1104 [Candolleomyces aberdarensis]
MSPNEHRKAIEANLIWMERTFKERATTETLLAPERENGLLTSHDYDAAVNFLPGPHRHYNTIATALGGCASYAARRPGWTGSRTASFVILGAFTGRAMGSAFAVWQYYRFIDSIQEPEGFSKAMENVQRRLGQPALHGPPIIAKVDPHHSSRPASDDGVREDTDMPVFSSNPVEQAPSNPPNPSQSQPQTSWDRIRAANSSKAQQSSWDAIRQSQGKASLQRQSQSNTSANSSGPGSYPDDHDRTEEQAKFNSLLEEERNYGQNN